MDIDKLMKQNFDDLKQQNIDTKVSSEYKNFSNNSNNNIIEIEHPNNLFDIKEVLEKLKEIRERRASFPKDFWLKDEENKLTSYLSSGIVLNEIPYHDDIMEGIIDLLEPYGYERESFVLDNLKNMSGNVCPLSFLGVGLARALRDHIEIDIDFFRYDENGNVIGVVEEKIEFFRYVVTHEFFHKLSSYKNGHNDIMVAGDSLLEGITDMLAHKATGNNKDKSDLYEFPVRVCEMFTEIIGMDNILHDYIKETGKFPNLRNLFSECGLDEKMFSQFRMGLDSVITGVRRDKENGISKEEWALDEKTSSLDFLRDNIVIPYCRNNPDKAEGVLNKFNNLFSNMGYTCSVEDVKTSTK